MEWYFPNKKYGDFKMRLVITTAIILLSSMFFHCDGGNENKLKIVEEYRINVPEPSGLVLSYDKKKLWTVSDENSTVYLMSLHGKIEKYFKVDAEDLEGIAVIDENSIAVVSEQTNEIVILSNDGKELTRHKLSLKSKENTGLEGITYDSKAKRFFVVQEKKTKILVEYNSHFKEIKRKELDFAEDLSGLCYMVETNDLWIISDESKLIAKCTTDGKIKSWRNVSINQIEGVAVNPETKKIYLVSDKDEKLYVLELFN